MTALPPKFGGPCRGAGWSPDMAKVLIVEDNHANMTLAVFLLQSAGHTVLSATDAEAGLTLARGEQPDLIVLAACGFSLEQATEHGHPQGELSGDATPRPARRIASHGRSVYSPAWPPRRRR